MNVSTLLPQVGGFVTSFIRKNKSTFTGPPNLLSPVRHPHGPFQFQAQIAQGALYGIEASTDFKTWLPISSGTAGAEPIDYVDSDASKFGFRFYRIAAAELFSRNVIGYATLSLPPGFAMVANPFHAKDNTVAALFPGLADGATLCKFDTRLFRLTNNSVRGGKWVNPSETLLPGEGAIVFNPTTDFKTLNFAGEVHTGNLLTSIGAGFSVRSSQIPLPGRLNGDLNFPLSDGDVIHIFDRDQQKYVVYPYPAKEWESSPPVLGVGESFWVGKTSPGNWVQNLPIS